MRVRTTSAAALGCDERDPYVARGLEYLRETQKPDGSWFGRWGINYVYGTWCVISALGALHTGHDMMERGCAWLLSVQNAPEHPLALAGLEVSPHHWPVAATHFDLQLHLRWEGETWAGSFAYNTDLFDAASIERMAGHFQTLLASLLAAPERPVAEAPMLTEAERQQRLSQWHRAVRAVIDFYLPH